MPSSSALRAIAVVAFAAAAAGCGSKEDVALSVYTQNVTLAKGDGPFGPGTVLSGTVDLVLDMGAYSSGSVTVDGVGLRLFRGNINVLARATISPTDGTVFPVTIGAGDKKTVHYSISIQQMTSQEATDLCAGPVSVSGTVQEDGKSTPTSVASTAITPSGC